MGGGGGGAYADAWTQRDEVAQDFGELHVPCGTLVLRHCSDSCSPSAGAEVVFGVVQRVEAVLVDMTHLHVGCRDGSSCVPRYGTLAGNSGPATVIDLIAAFEIAIPLILFLLCTYPFYLYIH